MRCPRHSIATLSGTYIRMNIVFAHQNFPAQFGAYGLHLAKEGHKVTFATAREDAKPPQGCNLIRMKPHRAVTKGVHRFARPFENAMINAQAFANGAIAARKTGLVPDIVMAHAGWGSGTLAKAVWPACKFVSYVEWYYRWPPVDVMPDDLDFSKAEDGRALALSRNTPTLLDLAQSDMVICPTKFQADQFPPHLRKQMTVLHDGVDTQNLCPNPDARPPLGGLTLDDDCEIITYATRGMEPQRGFCAFMEALDILQKKRPKLHALIGGEDRAAYGSKPQGGESWKAHMLERLDLDMARTHFTGLLSRNDFTALLQSTHVHVYLTMPFVLSWSMIEAMSIGCPLVASDTKPVREVAPNASMANFVDHNDIPALVVAIEELLDNRKKATGKGKAARTHAVKTYSQSALWAKRTGLLEDLVRG